MSTNLNARPVNLSIEIPAESLKKIVESGNLVSFVSKFPALAAGEIATQMVGQISKAATDKAILTNGVSIRLGMYFDDEFGNGRPHGPFPHSVDERISSVLTAAHAVSH